MKSNVDNKTKSKITCLTEGPIVSAILIFTIPLFISNIFQQFYNVADSFIISRSLGVDAFAAIGSAGPLNALIPGFGMGASAGFGILISRYYGARDGDGVRRSFFSGFFLCCVLSVALSVVFVPFAGPLLSLSKTPDNLLPDATIYLQILFLGTIITTLYNYLLISVRALGNSMALLGFLIFSSLLNIVLDFFFVMVWGWGIRGAAFATLLAQLIAAILCFLFIIKRVPVLITHGSLADITKKECIAQIQIGIPIGIMNFVIAVGTIFLQMSINKLGSDAVAAFAGVSKIDPFATNFLGSIGTGVGTFVAQNYGAQQYHRIKEGVKKITIIFVVYSIVIGVFMLIFGATIVQAVVGPLTPDIMEMCQIYFAINGPCYLFLCILYTMRNALQGIGLHKATTAVGFSETIMRVFAALLATTSLGFVAVSLASPLAWIASTILLSITYIKSMRTLTLRQKLSQDS